MTIAPLSVTPSAAAQAYRNVDGGGSPTAPSPAAGSFGNALEHAIQGAVDAGVHADAQATQAITGHGNITEVVTAVSKAELALQTTVALRDRMVQAYQDIMRMPI